MSILLVFKNPNSIFKFSYEKNYVVLNDLNIYYMYYNSFFFYFNVSYLYFIYFDFSYWDF